MASSRSDNSSHPVRHLAKKLQAIGNVISQLRGCIWEELNEKSSNSQDTIHNEKANAENSEALDGIGKHLSELDSLVMQCHEAAEGIAESLDWGLDEPGKFETRLRLVLHDFSRWVQSLLIKCQDPTQSSGLQDYSISHLWNDYRIRGETVEKQLLDYSSTLESSALLPANDDSGNKDAPQQSITFALTLKNIADKVGKSEETIRTAIKNSGVTRPGRGQHGYEYSPHDVSRIARKRQGLACSGKGKKQYEKYEEKRWNELLESIGEPSLDAKLQAPRRQN